MTGPLVKPYASLPDYADVEYVDGKLKVARGIITRTEDTELKRRWMDTVDILLDQRAALASLENELSGGTPPDNSGANRASRSTQS